MTSRGGVYFFDRRRGNSSYNTHIFYSLSTLMDGCVERGIVGIVTRFHGNIIIIIIILQQIHNSHYTTEIKIFQ